MNPKLIVVGAGFYGATVARRFVDTFNQDVLIMDIRSHIGGNAYSHFDPITGIEVHDYGTHIFHTNNQKVIDFVHNFLSCFTLTF